jgi:hypothetical protein
MRSLKLIISLVLMITLTACGQLVKSNVQAFHELPPEKHLSFAMLPLQDQEGSLEHKSYASLVKEELITKGYIEKPVEDADVIVFMNYGIDNGHEEISSYPIWGQTGTSSTYTTGNVTAYGNMATYNATTTSTPTYGVTGTGVSSHMKYKRFLTVELVDNKTFLLTKKIQKIYEGKVTSEGSSSTIAPVMPAMIKSLFEDFPGKSGKARTSIKSMQ